MPIRFVLLILLTVLSLPSQAQETMVTFDSGPEGWNGPTGIGGATNVVLVGGNPGAHLRTVFEDFGITFWTNTNQAFLGDFTGDGTVTVGLDLQVDEISVLGQPEVRELIVEFRSYDLAPEGFPWASVFFNLTSMASGDLWASHEVTFDPASVELPEGWGGFGAEDPVTFEPILPPGVTFADVMADVDELAFTNLVPGFGFLAHDHDVGIDNLRIVRGGSAGGGPIPETALPVPVLYGPVPLGLLILGLLGLALLSLRKRAV